MIINIILLILIIIVCWGIISSTAVAIFLILAIIKYEIKSRYEKFCVNRLTRKKLKNNKLNDLLK